MHKYSVQLAWSDEDGGYIATVPEFDGLSAFGETPEEAVAEAQQAIEGFVEMCEDHGEPLPEPMKRTPYSGQLRLRMPKSMHARLAALAAAEGVSLNTCILTRLSEGLGRAAAAPPYAAAADSVREDEPEGQA